MGRPVSRDAPADGDAATGVGPVNQVGVRATRAAGGPLGRGGNDVSERVSSGDEAL